MKENILELLRLGFIFKKVVRVRLQSVKMQLDNMELDTFMRSNFLYRNTKVTLLRTTQIKCYISNIN